MNNTSEPLTIFAAGQLIVYVDTPVVAGTTLKLRTDVAAVRRWIEDHGRIQVVIKSFHEFEDDQDDGTYPTTKT